MRSMARASPFVLRVDRTVNIVADILHPLGRATTLGYLKRDCQDRRQNQAGRAHGLAVGIVKEGEGSLVNVNDQRLRREVRSASGEEEAQREALDRENQGKDQGYEN